MSCIFYFLPGLYNSSKYDYTLALLPSWGRKGSKENNEGAWCSTAVFLAADWWARELIALVKEGMKEKCTTHSPHPTLTHTFIDTNGAVSRKRRLPASVNSSSYMSHLYERLKRNKRLMAAGTDAWQGADSASQEHPRREVTAVKWGLWGLKQCVRLRFKSHTVPKGMSEASLQINKFYLSA